MKFKTGTHICRRTTELKDFNFKNDRRGTIVELIRNGNQKKIQ